MRVGWGWNRESLQREAAAADRARQQAEDTRAWFSLYFGAMVTGVVGAALGRLLGHGAAWFGPGALYGGWTIGLVVAAGLFVSLLRDDRR